MREYTSASDRSRKVALAMQFFANIPLNKAEASRPYRALPTEAVAIDSNQQATNANDEQRSANRFSR